MIRHLLRLAASLAVIAWGEWCERHAEPRIDFAEWDRLYRAVVEEDRKHGPRFVVLPRDVAERFFAFGEHLATNLEAGHMPTDAEHGAWEKGAN